MEERSFMNVKEVAKELGISQSKAYAVIRQLNGELKAKGYLTLSGRVSRAYFNEKWYGGVNGG